MNERIKELLEQSTDVYDEWKTGKSHSLVDHKMFAELIVKECADLFEVEWGSSMLQGTTAAHYLKQHFGVQE